MTPPSKMDMAEALAAGANPDALLLAAKAGGILLINTQAVRHQLASRGIEIIDNVVGALAKKSAPESKLALVQTLYTEVVIQTLAAALELKEPETLAAMQRLRVACGSSTAVADLRHLVEKELRRVENHVAAGQPEKKARRMLVDTIGLEMDKDEGLLAIVKAAQLPSGLVMPTEYEIDMGRIWLVKVSREGEVFREEVVRGLVFPAGRLREVDGGDEHVVLVWKSPGRWEKRAVRMDDAMVARQLAALSRYGVPVDSGSAAGVIRWFRAFLSANERTLPVARTSPRMGWRDAKNSDDIEGFLWGSTWLNGGRWSNADISAVEPSRWARETDNLYLSVQQEGLSQIAKGYKRRGDIAGWNEAITPLLRYPRAYLGVLASLVPPLLRFTPQASNFVVDWSARSSFGKTTTLLAAASVWGMPDIRGGGAIHSWGSSDTYIERVASTACDMPVILDDTRRARTPNVIRDVVMSVAQGLGRGRGTISGIQQTQTWRTVLLSSGEESIIDLVQVGGAAARTLAILDPPFPEESGAVEAMIRQLEVGLSAHHGSAGPALCQWLAQVPSHRTGLEGRWNEAAERLSRVAPSGAFAQRAVRYLASIALAYEVAEKVGIVRPPSLEPIFDVVWGALRSSTDAADLETRALTFLFSRISQRPEAFIGREQQDRDGTPRAPSGGWWGAWSKDADYEHIALYPTQVEHVLKEGGFVASAILRGWNRRGWLKTTAVGNTCPMTVRNERVRMVVIKQAALAACDLVSTATPPSYRTEEQTEIPF